MAQPSSLKSKTIRGLFWSFADLMLNHGIQFIIQIVLARILLPEHFGVIGMILVFIAISNSIVDCGFSQALIRDQDSDQEDYSTIFYFNLIIAFLIYVILFMCAPYISAFFNVPQLIEITRILFLVIIINALAIIHRVKLIKMVDFKTLSKVNIISVIISGIITITLAQMGFGVWSLVINLLSMQFLQMLLLWFFYRWRPSFLFSMKSFNKYFKFGYKLLISGIIDTLYNNIYFLIIGKFHTSTHLGYFTNATRVRDIASNAISTTIQRVSYPVLSSIQEDEERLKYGFEKILKTAAFINFPLMIGLSAIANPLFHILFGEKWIPSVIYFQLLCIAGMLFPLHAINLNILQVKGRSDLFLRLEIIKKIFLTILIGLTLFLNLGIIGLIWTAIISSFGSFFINTYYSARLIGYSTKNQVKDLFPFFFISMMMGIVVYLVGYLLPNIHLFELVAQVCIGIALYILISKVLRIQELNTIYELISPILKKVKTLSITKKM